MPKSKKSQEILDDMLSVDGLKKLEELAKKGHTLDEIAHKQGISRSTLYRWSLKHQDISDAISNGKHVADDRVELSLYEACFGRDEKEITLEKDDQGNIVKQVIRTKYVPPNITAIQYWLSNRRGSDWKARQQLEMSAESAIPIMFTDDLNTKKNPSISESDKD